MQRLRYWHLLHLKKYHCQLNIPKNLYFFDWQINHISRKHKISFFELILIPTKKSRVALKSLRVELPRSDCQVLLKVRTYLYPIQFSWLTPHTSLRYKIHHWASEHIDISDSWYILRNFSKHNYLGIKLRMR